MNRTLSYLPSEKEHENAKKERYYLIMEEKRKARRFITALLIFFVSFVLGFVWILNNVDLVKMFLYS